MCDTRGESEDSLHAGHKACKSGDPLWLSKPGQNRGISSATKRTLKGSSEDVPRVVMSFVFRC